MIMSSGRRRIFRRWPRQRTRRRAFVVVLLAGLSALIVLRVSSTLVELDLEVYEAAFSLVERQNLTDPLSLRSLGVSGLREIRLPRTSKEPAETLSAEQYAAMAVRLSVSGEEGSLTLAPLVLPPRTECRIALGGMPGRLRLLLTGDGLEFELVADGRVRLEVPGRRTATLELPSPRSLTAVPLGRALELDLELDEGSGRDLASQLEVEDLAFLRLDEVRTPEGVMARVLSTIRGGALHFESLGGREYPLRTGELLRFDAPPGWLRSLRLEDDHLAFNFRGEVRGLTVGSEDSRRCLMPSWLDWLRSRQELILVWASALGFLRFLEIVFGWR